LKQDYFHFFFIKTVFSETTRYLIINTIMNEDDELSDEQVEEMFENLAELINNLKAKADAAKNRKKSLPAWLIYLLEKNKPSQN